MQRFMDPFEEMDRMFNTFGNRNQGGLMPLDAFEKDDVYTLRFDIPGVDPSSVDLTVEGDILTVTAERPVEETEGATWLLRERPAGTHRREVRLGDRLDSGKVEARYDGGVLTVTVPMREEAKPHKISVKPAGHDRLTADAVS